MRQKRVWFLVLMNIRDALMVGSIGIVLIASAFSASADGLTVGLLLNTDRAFDGYTLFTPIVEGNAYLIDNAGRAVHSWDKGTGINVTPYLLEDGSVIRMDDGITQDDWDGSLVWRFDYPEGHHDIEVLPNGNVLVLARDIRTTAEAIAEGSDRDASSVSSLLSEKIVEVRRTGPTSGEIVWEWYVWDHLIQDFDPTKSNFAVVGEHPELIDINFGLPFDSGGVDWLHANGIDYNPELDQIAISVRQFSELWIIDHGTTTEEAASHSGGMSGMGGDLLYRWGNPQSYRAGGTEDQQLFVQHDVQWITPGLPGEGNLLMFNNGDGRPGGLDYSSIEEIAPPVDDSGSYPISPGEAFAPVEPIWSYSNGEEFYSSLISGVGRLPNGNTLITSGVPGIIFEVTPDSETVWKYVNPIEATGPLTQGDPVETNGLTGPVQVFRAIRYAPDYPGLVGRDLTPGATLEIVLDSDEDGLFDHDETKTYDTDPLAADTDGDGFSDGDEILIYGTDPLLPALIGDVNCDDAVSSIDAALILQLTARVVGSLSCEKSADVNEDGATTSIDAAIVLQFTAGLLPSLPP